MIDASKIPEPSLQQVKEIVQEGRQHVNYAKTVRRAKIMRLWYDAGDDDTSSFQKSAIIKRSPIESNADYQSRLDRIKLLPLETKFIQTQKRIYDENNVQRTYPKGSFWKEKEAHFDEEGDEIDVFFRDKVLYTKEAEGFGAICLDLAVDEQGNTVSDNGKAIPYPYVVQAEDVQYFENWYGHLKLCVVSSKKGDRTEYRAFTPKFIYVFADKEAEPRRYPHKFGKTPAYLLKGELDSSAKFKVGRPRRWHLRDLYLSASELLYDLQDGTRLFALPITAYPQSMIKSIAGAYNEDTGKFDPNIIKKELGMSIAYPDDNPPNKLFYQADMQGLQHLDSVIFNSLLNFIWQLGMVRDKSKVVHNASGRSKQFDSVEEQGLLAQTATDMEAIEKEIFSMMANVRGEKTEDFNTVYSKHHDLSSADEIWTQFTEGMQYGGVPTTVKGYQVTEYLRKKSAPEEYRKALEEELEENGFPLSSEEVDALKDRIDDALLIQKARPELKKENIKLKEKQVDEGGTEPPIDNNN